MDIKKAVITAAGKNQRMLPLQTLVDRSGRPRAALGIIIEEILQAGLEQICIVIHPGDRAAYIEAAGPHASRIEFVEQRTPLGFGHAVFCARAFTGSAPFLLLVGDHLYVSGTEQPCAQQLVEVATTERCAVSAVQATHESKLPYYGAVGGRRLPNRKGLYEITEVIEKPTPTEAEQKLVVPGLRSGHYLCFFGMHVLPPAVMEVLEETLGAAGAGGNTPLSPALARLAARERYLACELQGRRYDIGATYGLLTAQLALAIEGKDREEVLSGLVELLASRGR